MSDDSQENPSNITRICSYADCTFSGQPQSVVNFAKCLNGYQGYCKECTKKSHKVRRENRIVVKLADGTYKDDRQQDRARLLKYNPASEIIGMYDRKSESLINAVKRITSSDASSIVIHKAKRVKKFKTAKQAAREIMARVKTVNSDRVINRYARVGERALWANLHDTEGNLLNWFENKWDSSTHCELTGIEFQVEGPFSKSPDQKIPGGGYGEDNVRVVCQMYNFCKHTYADEIVFDFIRRSFDHLSKQMLST